MFDVFPSIVPLLFLACGAMLYLVFEASPLRGKGSSFVALLSVVCALAFLIGSKGIYNFNSDVAHALIVDPICWGFSLLILASLLGSLLLSISSVEPQGIDAKPEYYCLMLLATVGALVFVGASNLLVLYVGMELMSLAIYPLASSVLGCRASAEAGLKYFILGAFSSALLLYGIALLYGLTGSLGISQVLSEPVMESMAGALALGLLLSGILFKLGAVPMHFWVPDVYQGAPFPVTAYMSSVVKVASVGVICRIVYSLASESLLVWEGFLWISAVLTMVLGNVCALRQSSVKRMLAFSSVAHAGYILIGVMANDVFPVVMYYLVGYVFMTLGIFSILIPTAKGASDLTVRQLRGFGWRKPWHGVSLSIFILGMAGLPPGLVGLFGKLYVFQEAVRTGYTGLVVIACLCSAVGCYYYLRVVAELWSEQAPDDNTETSEKVVIGVFPNMVAFCCLLVTTIVGFMPDSIFPFLVSLFETSAL
jgi:NADH-quinone oxidoreductase subunit N